MGIISGKRIYQLHLKDGEVQTKTLSHTDVFETWLQGQGKYIQCDNGLSYLKTTILKAEVLEGRMNRMIDRPVERSK